MHHWCLFQSKVHSFFIAVIYFIVFDTKLHLLPFCATIIRHNKLHSLCTRGPECTKPCDQTQPINCNIIPQKETVYLKWLKFSRYSSLLQLHQQRETIQDLMISIPHSMVDDRFSCISLVRHSYEQESPSWYVTSYQRDYQPPSIFTLISVF